MRQYFIRFLFSMLVALAFTLILLPLQPAHAFGYVVTKLADTNDGVCNADCSLREAITVANATLIDDSITFSISGSIGLNSTLPNLASAATAGTLTITGGGTITVTRGSGTFRIMSVLPGANVTINSLTITNGSATIVGVTLGGAIYNAGTLIVNGSTFSGNNAMFYGGGIYNAGALTVDTSSFTTNIADYGGGLFNDGVMLTVTNSTFSTNNARLDGGGIYNNGPTMTATNITVSGNTAVNKGGGIDNNYTMTVTNSFIFGNRALTGDGIYNDYFASVTNTCLVGNGDTAVVGSTISPAFLTATDNWWGTAWGPNIPVAPALTGSIVSSGDSISGTGQAASSVNVGITTIPTDYGTYSTAPIGNWKLTAPSGCGTCTAVSGTGSPRTCITPRP